jgi:magnesium transporter
MIKLVLQAGPHGPVTGTRLEDLDKIITDEQTTVWVDVIDATPEEIAHVGKKFEFHPLALEDVERGGQRPKIDQYDGYQFIVFYAITTEFDRCKSHEVNIFVGKHFMVSFHDSALPVVTDTAERWHSNVATLGNRGTGFLLYSLLDSLVDGYFPVIDDIAERAETLEESIILQGQPALQAEILRLRRELLMIRRVVGPERDVMNILVRQDPPLYGRKEIAYFQDVYDHLLRIADSVDIYRDMLSSVLDANLSMVSYTLNVVVKRLTSYSIILMSISIIAGVYGMNFMYMPELNWQFGYPFALGLMVVIATVEVSIFRRVGWL